MSTLSGRRDAFGGLILSGECEIEAFEEALARSCGVERDGTRGVVQSTVESSIVGSDLG